SRQRQRDLARSTFGRGSPAFATFRQDRDLLEGDDPSVPGAHLTVAEDLVTHEARQEDLVLVGQVGSTRAVGGEGLSPGDLPDAFRTPTWFRHVHPEEHDPFLDAGGLADEAPTLAGAR